MALRRYGNKRDEIEAECIEALEQVGCVVYPLDLPLDALVSRIHPKHGPWNILLEFKAPGTGRLTKDQQEFIRTWKGPYAVVHSKDEALAAVGVAI